MRRLRAATRHFALAQPRPRQLERPRVGGAAVRAAQPERERVTGAEWMRLKTFKHWLCLGLTWHPW